MSDDCTPMLESIVAVAMYVFELTHPGCTIEEMYEWADELTNHYFGNEGTEQFEVLELRRRAKLMMQDLTDRL
jgi:hypothetical protein